MNDGSETTQKTDRHPGSRRRKILWTLLIGVLVVLALIAARRHGEVEVEVVLVGEDFVQGKPILMTFVVKNVAEHEIEVDAWQPFPDDDPERCKSFEGIPVELVLFYESYPEPVLRTPHEPGDQGIRTLVPGERLSFQCDIAYMFGIVKPGKYVLEARYFRAPWAHRPALALPARWWASSLSHEAVAFEVRSRIYDEKNTESKIRGDLR